MVIISSIPLISNHGSVKAKILLLFYISNCFWNTCCQSCIFKSHELLHLPTEIKFNTVSKREISYKVKHITSTASFLHPVYLIHKVYNWKQLYCSTSLQNEVARHIEASEAKYIGTMYTPHLSFLCHSANNQVENKSNSEV